MQEADAEVVRRDLALAAQFAAVFVRPLDVFDEHAGRLEPFTATETRTAAAHPAFRAPFNRALTATLRLSDTVIGGDQIDRLRTDVHLRCAVLLVSQPMNLVRQAAVIASAAVLHRRVLKLALKAEIARIREIFGPDGFEIATREAPLLHGVMAELDAGADPAIFDAVAKAEQGQRALIDFGLQVLCGFVSHAEPALSELMSRRCQSDLDRQARARPVGPLSAVHCDHVVRLIRRRLPSWAAIIG